MSFSADPVLAAGSCAGEHCRRRRRGRTRLRRTTDRRHHPSRVADRRWRWAAGLSTWCCRCVLWWSVWSSHPPVTTTCGCGDAARFLWFFEWPAFALTHGHCLSTRSALFHPAGINLLNDTSVLALGVVLTPVTWLFGPVAGHERGPHPGPGPVGSGHVRAPPALGAVDAGRRGRRTGLRVLALPGDRTGPQPVEHRLSGRPAAGGHGHSTSCWSDSAGRRTRWGPHWPPCWSSSSS